MSLQIGKDLKLHVKMGKPIELTVNGLEDHLPWRSTVTQAYVNRINCSISALRSLKIFPELVPS